MFKRGQKRSDEEKKRRFAIHKLKFRKVKTWMLLVALVVLLFVDATLLRMNHLKMVELRSAVLTADELEDDEATQDRLEELKNYVFSHIVFNVVEENGKQQPTFGTGPFYLEHQYIRAANRALDEAEHQLANDANPNGNIYQMASNVCSPQAIANGWDWNTPAYINCMMGEIEKYPASAELSDQIKASLPSTELFRKNFASPIWTPSVAGFLILITILVALVVIWRGIAWLFLRISLLFV